MKRALYWWPDDDDDGLADSASSLWLTVRTWEAELSANQYYGKQDSE